MKNRIASRTKGRIATLAAAVEATAPAVRELCEIAYLARGVARQYRGIPHDGEGPQKMLDRCQERIDRRYEAVIGRKLAPDSYAAPEVIGMALDAVRRLAELVGATIKTDIRPNTARIWTDDPSIFYKMERDDPDRQFIESRYRLAVRPKLKEDGSLARPLPKVEEEGDE